MKTCSEEVNRDAFQATVCGAKVQVEQFQTPLLFPPEITQREISIVLGNDGHNLSLDAPTQLAKPNEITSQISTHY